MEDELASGGGRIDLLGEALEADAALGERRNHLDQVFQRAAQAIEPPDNEGVPFPQIPEDVLSYRTFCFRSARGFLIDLAAAGLFEGIQLQIEGLFPVETRA